MHTCICISCLHYCKAFLIVSFPLVVLPPIQPLQSHRNEFCKMPLQACNFSAKNLSVAPYCFQNKSLTTSQVCMVLVGWGKPAPPHFMGLMPGHSLFAGHMEIFVDPWRDGSSSLRCPF